MSAMVFGIRIPLAWQSAIDLFIACYSYLLFEKKIKMFAGRNQKKAPNQAIHRIANKSGSR